MSPVKFTSHELPMFHCPACLSLSRIDDYWDIDEGSDNECQKCGVTSEAIEVEHTTIVTWEVKKPNDEAQSERKPSP